MDFSKLRFNFTKESKNVLVIKQFPQLAEYVEFEYDADDQLLRIAILTCDNNSPFVISEREDYERRLQKTFEYLKIKDNQLLNELNMGANQKFEDMVTRFFMMHDNLAYSMWADKLRIFHYIGISLRQPPSLTNMVADVQKRSQLEQQRKQIYNDLIDYEAQVFPDLPTRKKLREKLTKLIQPAEKYSQAKSVI